MRSNEIRRMSNSNLGKEKRKAHFREACAKALRFKKKGKKERNI